VVRARYLDLELLGTPSLALDRARLEILHMGDHVREMLRSILPAMLTGRREAIDAVAKMDDSVDILYGEILTFLGQISKLELAEAQTEEFMHLIEAANDLENIGDIIETNLVALGRQRLEANVHVSAPTQAVIREFHATVTKAFENALLAITQKNEEAARAVIEMKQDINRLAGSATLHEARRLVAAEPNRLPAYTVEVDILENLKRVYYFCKRMARIVVASEAPSAAD
jgi:phosphate:Na+ symporter